jgi:hypothetical protein
MALPDPDQDLLNKLDRRQRRSEYLSLAPGLGAALAAGLASFAVARFGLHWDAETARDGAALVGIFGACLACFFAWRGERG